MSGIDELTRNCIGIHLGILPLKHAADETAVDSERRAIDRRGKWTADESDKVRNFSGFDQPLDQRCGRFSRMKRRSASGIGNAALPLPLAFADVLRMIAELRPPPDPAPA